MKCLFSSCFLFGLIMVLSACSNKKQKDDLLLKSMNESLLYASANTEGQIAQIMKGFQVKMQDPSAHENAVLWNQKAESIYKLTNDVYEYIDTLKQGLSKASNGIYESMLENDKGKKLYNLLVQSRAKSLAVDSAINEAFRYMKVITTRSFDSLPEAGKDFTKYFFKDVSSQQAIGTLTKFQCDLKSVEYQMILFCYRQTVDVIYDCERNSPKFMVYHTTKTVKPNEAVEVVVQVDEDFFRGRKPVVTLSGLPLKLDVGWTATKSIIASEKPGKHSIPITISYKDFITGQEYAVTRMFDYYVDSTSTNQ